jgi:hypothetical protein
MRQLTLATAGFAKHSKVTRSLDFAEPEGGSHVGASGLAVAQFPGGKLPGRPGIGAGIGSPCSPGALVQATRPRAGGPMATPSR